MNKVITKISPWLAILSLIWFYVFICVILLSVYRVINTARTGGAGISEYARHDPVSIILEWKYPDRFGRVSETAASEAASAKSAFVTKKDRELEAWALKYGKITHAGRVREVYRREIEQAARLSGLKPELIAAVIAVEWDGRQKASAKGARGQMGLMPATAWAIGVKNINDPGDNIAGGARYLREQLDRFSDLDMALAAYNAGPANVLKFGGIPPFRETVNYVERVKFLAYLE